MYWLWILFDACVTGFSAYFDIYLLELLLFNVIPFSIKVLAIWFWAFGIRDSEYGIELICLNSLDEQTNFILRIDETAVRSRLNNL